MANSITFFQSSVLPDGSLPIFNNGLSVTVGSNACTVALKTKDGATDAAPGNPVSIPFRSATATSGSYTSLNVSAALSVVIPASTTIGTVSALASNIYVYAINNAGAVELAVSLSQFDEGTVQNTSAISGGSNPAVLYSTAARTGVAVRLLGRFVITEATAGTWATAPTEVSNIPFYPVTVAARGTNTAGTSIVSATDTLLAVVVDTDTHGALATTGTYTAPMPGRYALKGSLSFSDAIGAGDLIGIKFKKNASTVVTDVVSVTSSAGVNQFSMTVSDTVKLVAGDTIGMYVNQNSGAGRVLGTTANRNFFCVERIGS